MKREKEEKIVVRVDTDIEGMLLICSAYSKEGQQFCIFDLVSCHFCADLWTHSKINSLGYDLWAYNSAHRIVNHNDVKEWIKETLKNEFHGAVRIIYN